MNKTRRTKLVRNYLKLGKFSVILPVSLSAITGFFLFSPHPGIKMAFVFLGVLFQGFSASALNQVQERKWDALMERTKFRPIPSGEISSSQALAFTTFTFMTGTILLYIGGNFLTMVLGIFTILWYNGFYTPLKKITAFAVIPGSITGAIPPVIGWVGAGGHIADKTSVLLAFLFFVGQVPHFWLLMLKYGQQYKNAGLPSLSGVFSIRQINNLSFIWIASSLVSALMLASFGIIQSFYVNAVLVFITVSGLIAFLPMLNKEESEGNRRYFMLLNLYYLILMVLLIMDRTIR